MHTCILGGCERALRKKFQLQIRYEPANDSAQPVGLSRAGALFSGALHTHTHTHARALTTISVSMQAMQLAT